MLLLYCFCVIGLELFMLNIAMMLSLLPGNWYKSKISSYQLILSGLSFSFLFFGFIVIGLEGDSIPENSIGNPDGFLILSLLPMMFFAASIYNFITCVKDNLPQITLSLRKDEYRLESKMSFQEYSYYTTINCYAVTEDKVILLLGDRPDKEIDADFICHKLGEGYYSCIGYCPKEHVPFFKRLVKNIGIFIFHVALISFPLVLVYQDYRYISGASLDGFDKYFKFFMLYVLGYISNYFFSGTRGICRGFKYFGVMLMILSLIPS